MPRPMLAEALRYGSMGLAVIPLHGKKPFFENWPDVASADPATIAGWFQEIPEPNAGIVTGCRSGIFVVDIDPKNGGQESYEELLRQHGQFPDTWTDITGSGGRHLFFRYPDFPVRNCAGLFPGIDIRGEGGQVVVPPSIHPDTHKAYEWDGLKTPCEGAPLADAPGWLLEVLRARNGKTHAAVVESKIPCGKRHDTLVRYAGTMRNAGGSFSDILAALSVMNLERCEEPELEKNVRKIAESICKYPPGKVYIGPDAPQVSEPEENGPREPTIRTIEEIPRLEDFASEPIEWGVAGLFPMAAVTLFSSESGDGKSTVISKAAYCMSIGSTFLGRACSKRPVLYLDVENSHSVVLERFQRLHIGTHDGFPYWGQWLPDEPPSAGGAIVWEWVARCDPKPVIIVDSLIGFHPGAENDSSETRRYMAQYRKLASAGVGVILQHHSGKGENTKEYRGSSDIKASVDVAYHLANLSDDGTLGNLRLRAFKMRFSATPELVFRYVDGEFVVDERTPCITVTEALVRLLKSHPGVRAGEFEQLAGEKSLGRNRARQFLQDGVTTKTVTMLPGKQNTKVFYWGESCPSLV